MRISWNSKGDHPPPQKSAATFQHCNLVFGMKIPSSVWNVNQVLIQASGQVLGSRSFEQQSFCALSVESRYPQRLIYIRFCFFHFYVNPWPYKLANSATANDTLVISVLFSNQSHFLLFNCFYLVVWLVPWLACGSQRTLEGVSMLLPLCLK